MLHFLIFVLTLIVDTLINAIFTFTIGIFNPFSILNTAIMKIWAKIILISAGIKLEVLGKENIQKNSSYVVIANHQSLMDIPVAITALPTNVRFISKKELFKIPFWGWVMKSVGILKIDRADSKQAITTLKKAEKIIQHHHLSILAFPEGTRSHNGLIHQFKKGPFVLAINGGLPLLPVSISGTRNILPKGEIRINSGKVKVIIHPPLSVDNLSYKDRSLIANKTKEIIEEGFIEGFG